jgi:hypothetical protein
MDEKKDSAKIGGPIHLFCEDGHTGPDINPAPARRQTLTVSSRLRKLV